MKKIAILLLIMGMVACNNKSNQNNSNENTSELPTEAIISDNESISKKEPVTLDFPTYHLYGDDSEKYDASGRIPSKAIITIDEDAQKAVLKLYDGFNNRWDSFSFKIESKHKLSENSVMFLVLNNANKKSYIHVAIDETEGIYIDVKYFEYDGMQIACWMKDNDEGTATYSETPNTYESSSNNSSNINGGSLHSNEGIYGNYYYYKETNNCVEGVVVYEGRGGYCIVETDKGYTVLEDYSGTLYEDAMVRGELNDYNYKYIINRNGNKEIKVYIYDYMLSDIKALDWLGKHDKLKNNDQETYNANND